MGLIAPLLIINHSPPLASPISELSDPPLILDLLLDLEKNPGARVYTDEEYDLAKYRVWLEALGNPHLGQHFIHIAGTKGKGSTAAICEGLLRAAGFHTALYSSPHLTHFGERFRFDGVPWTMEEFERRLEEFYGSLSREQRVGIDQPHRYRTVFEVLTALAFRAFGERARQLQAEGAAPQVAIIETGLGGRLDCTNVIEPTISVITVLGMDHTKILGDTIEQIASEKAGIIKKGRPTVVARQHHSFSERVWPVLIEKARAEGSPVIRAWDHSPVLRTTPTPNGQRVVVELPDAQPLEAELPLRGEFQLTNLESALSACWYVCRELKRGLTPEMVRKGLGLVSWPGRVEVHPGGNHQVLVLDGAHCPLSAAAFSRELLRLLDNAGGSKQVCLLLGMQRDKRIDRFLEALVTAALRKRVAAIVTYPIDSPRAATPEDLAEACAGFAERVVPAGSLEEAIRLGLETGANLAVTGSLYGLSPARAIWQRMHTSRESA